MLARTYAALPFEYLDTLAALSDAQFGKLMRWLLRYAATGEYGALSGQAAIFRESVRVNEDRFRDSYEALAQKRSEAGKKGAQARWGKPVQTQTNSQPPTNSRTRYEYMRRMLEMDDVE